MSGWRKNELKTNLPHRFVRLVEQMRTRVVPMATDYAFALPRTSAAGQRRSGCTRGIRGCAATREQHEPRWNCNDSTLKMEALSRSLRLPSGYVIRRCGKLLLNRRIEVPQMKVPLREWDFNSSIMQRSENSQTNFAF